MSTSTLDRLREERDSQVAFIESLMAAAESEDRDLVEAELANVTAAKDRIAEIEAQAKPIQEFEQARASASFLDQRLTPATPKGTVRGGIEVIEGYQGESLGDIFVNSQQFREYSGRGTMAPVRIEGFRAIETRATGPDPLMIGVDPGKKLLPAVQKVRGPEHFPRYPILNLVGTLQVEGPSITYVVTTEATGADVVDEGGLKPFVEWDVAEESHTLEMVAGVYKWSRQAEKSIPAIRDLINTKIRQAIDKKLAGLAIAALNGAFGVGNTTTGAAGKPLVEVVRLAIADLESAGIVPTAILANPTDLAEYDVAMLGKPLGAANINGGMWGLPLVPVPQITAGTAVVGRIDEGLVWAYNEGLELYVTDSDISGEGATTKSDFRRNLKTALGEVYGKFIAADKSVIRKAVVTP